MAVTVARAEELGWRQVLRPRRIAISAVAAGAAVAAVVVASGSARPFTDALARGLRADPGWLAVAVAAEAASIAGYVALLALAARIDWRTSYRISLGGAAVTRLLPTAGVGGAAFSVWALRRAGRPGRAFLRFLVLLYTVFLLALLAGGAIVAASGRGWALAPAGLAVAALVAGALLGVRGTRGLGGAVREAAAVLRTGDGRLAGAPVWWGFDMLVLWSTLQAVGSPPAAGILLLAYCLGAAANTVPVPGAPTGGIVGALIALGSPASTAIAGVLAYRAIAVWLPVPFGAHAIAALHRAK